MTINEFLDVVVEKSNMSKEVYDDLKNLRLNVKALIQDCENNPRSSRMLKEVEYQIENLLAEYADDYEIVSEYDMD